MKAGATWRLDELTRDEAAELGPNSTIVVPLGSTEQHGHHLPLGADSIAVTQIAELAAARAAPEIPVVLAPTLPYGFAHHHVGFAGTATIGMAAYIDVLTDLGQSLAGFGSRRILFLNGHGGNESAARAAADRLVYELRSPAHVAAVAYWVLARDALAELHLTTSVVPGHAGSFETSVLLAVRPDLVHLDRRPPKEAEPQPVGRVDLLPAHVRRPGIWSASDGRSDDASGADPAEGERIVRAIATAVGSFLVRFHRSVPDGG